MPTKILTTHPKAWLQAKYWLQGRLSLTAAMILAVSLAGCSNEPFPLEKVSGKVVYEDGTPVQADSIQVIFKPQDVDSVGEKSARGSKGMADPHSGEFDTLSTWKTGDGVICGTHKVAVIPFRKQKQGMDIPDTSVAPKQYFKTRSTPLEVVVSRGGENYFELVIPKPSS